MAADASSPRASAFIVDNSVWSRLSTSPVVVAAFKAVANLYSPSNLLLCPPVAAEFGFSAPSGPDHTRLMEELAAFPECELAPNSRDVLDIQNRLWNSGLLRAAGSTNTLIAAYALKNEAIILHYDQDFEHIAKVMPELKTQWIVPRGSS